MLVFKGLDNVAPFLLANQKQKGQIAHRKRPTFDPGPGSVSANEK